jgi:hypothetical protein
MILNTPGVFEAETLSATLQGRQMSEWWFGAQALFAN